MTGATKISELLGDDHQRLDALWDLVQTAAPTDHPNLRERFDQFQADLLRHMSIEEEELFPKMLAGDPAQRVLVERLVEEHRQIQDVLARIALELDRGAVLFHELRTELLNVLWAHNAREEDSAYPWFDGILPSSEVARLRARITVP